MKKLVIWDLDGTLFDTTRAMQFCGNTALKEIGYQPFARMRYARFSGGGVEGFVGAILDAAGDREHRHFDQFWQAYLASQKDLPADANRIYPGIRRVLQQCKAKGVKMAVLSNKDESSCRAIVSEAFGDTFDLVLGNTPDRPAKPDPAGVLAIAECFDATSDQILYVGDTSVDLDCATRAGVPCAAALWGYRTKEELSSYHPVLWAEKPQDLIPVILES